MSTTITSNDAQYAWDIVNTICTEVGPGTPGSSQEWGRAAVIQRELESNLGAENVVVEEFIFAPSAFLTPYPGIFILLAALLNTSTGYFAGVSPWLITIAALTFSILAAMLYISQLIVKP